MLDPSSSRSAMLKTLDFPTKFGLGPGLAPVWTHEIRRPFPALYATGLSWRAAGESEEIMRVEKSIRRYTGSQLGLRQVPDEDSQKANPRETEVERTKGCCRLSPY